MAHDTIQTAYITALKNTHAMEQQALQIMNRQVERIESYPEMSKLLKNHIKETETQRTRLELALKAVDEDPSTIKEAVLGFVGNVMAMGHIPADDEVLKNSLANHAFENYEIAAYTTLITIAEEAGQQQFISEFQKSLAEEKAMAENVHDLIEPTTQRYLKIAVREGTSSAKI